MASYLTAVESNSTRVADVPDELQETAQSAKEHVSVPTIANESASLETRTSGMPEIAQPPSSNVRIIH